VSQTQKSSQYLPASPLSPQCLLRSLFPPPFPMSRMVFLMQQIGANTSNMLQTFCLLLVFFFCYFRVFVELWIFSWFTCKNTFVLCWLFFSCVQKKKKHGFKVSEKKKQRGDDTTLSFLSLTLLMMLCSHWFSWVIFLFLRQYGTLCRGRQGKRYYSMVLYEVLCDFCYKKI